jgi:hypothetical protein
VGDRRGSPSQQKGDDETHADPDENRLIRFYRGLRRDVSLLLSEGHAHARDYPIAYAWSEARIVRQRNASRRKMDAALMQMTIGSVMDSKAGKRLAELLKRLDESD